MYLNNSKETLGTHSTILRNEFIRNYIPNTVKIQKGDTIRWINTFLSHSFYVIL
jgi:plastocyanin